MTEIEKLTYDQAVQELEILLQEMENGEISIDEISKKIKRSAQLIQFCQTKLKSTQEDVQSILVELES